MNLQNQIQVLKMQVVKQILLQHLMSLYSKYELVTIHIISKNLPSLLV
jgi:hypothetical protein